MGHQIKENGGCSETRASKFLKSPRITGSSLSQFMRGFVKTSEDLPSRCDTLAANMPVDEHTTTPDACSSPPSFSLARFVLFTLVFSDRFLCPKTDSARPFIVPAN